MNDGRFIMEGEGRKKKSEQEKEKVENDCVSRWWKGGSQFHVTLKSLYF